MAQWQRRGRSGRRGCIKRGGPEEGTLLIKGWGWEKGDKGFFLAGNGELSEQEGGRQQGGLEPKQGISNLNPSR